MYHHILAAVDGSPVSEAVLPYVKTFATCFECHVTLLYVARPGEEPVIGRWKAYPAEGSRPISNAEYLESLARNFRAGGISTLAKVLSGYPATEIARFASERGYDLIAMGTHGWSGTALGVYGSTADKVLQMTPLPVLLARAPGDTPSQGHPGELRNLVVPWDGSAAGDAALTHAQALAREMRLTLRLLYVAPGEELALSLIGPDLFDPRRHKESLQKAEARLSSLARKLQKDGLGVSASVEEGFPPDRIIDFAAQMQGSLIIMATHGQTAGARWALGSVTDRVLRASTRPILVIRP